MRPLYLYDKRDLVFWQPTLDLSEKAVYSTCTPNDANWSISFYEQAHETQFIFLYGDLPNSRQFYRS